MRTGPQAKVVLLLGFLLVPGVRAAAQVRRVPSPHEFAAQYAMAAAADTLRAELLIPDGQAPMRSVVVVMGGIASFLYDNTEWRALCARSRCALLRLRLPREPALATGENGPAVLTLLESFASASTRPELRSAKLLFIGSSAVGAFGASFASWKPERAAGFIAYHTNMNEAPKDWTKIATLPALLLQGALDNANRRNSALAALDTARRQGAPWGLVLHANQPHTSLDGVREASPLMVRWVEAILQRQTHTSASDGAVSRINAAASSTGWLVGDRSGEIARAGAFPRDSVATSWFPSEGVIMARFPLVGACNAFPLGLATEVLGPGTTRAGTSDDTWSCGYSAQDSTGMRSIVVSFSGWGQFHDLQRDDVAKRFHDNQRSRGGRVYPKLGDAAYFAVNSATGCSALAALKASEVVQAMACGRGFGTASDAAVLDRIIRRILGGLQ